MAENIVTSQKPSGSSPLDPPSRIICHVCQKQFSRYTCPRCNSRYCSRDCYQSHSVRCTESFMKENVLQELKQLQPDDARKRQMQEILKQFHSEEVDGLDYMDEDDSFLSEETIQKVLSGDQVSFDDLSGEEKKRFQRAVASGELGKMIKPWDPWWLKPSARNISLSRQGTRLVQSLDDHETKGLADHDQENDSSSDIPLGPDSPLPPVSKLSSTGPSPLLAVHLVDITYSYCFTLRLYNGEWQSDSLGAAMVILSVSSVLGQNGQPQTVLEALSYCLEQTCSPAYRHAGGLQFGLGLIDDVITILSLGGPALICMLCDLQRLIQAGERELKSEKSKLKSKSIEIKSKLRLAERKTYFIMCWVHEQPAEAWASLASIVGAEKSSTMNYTGGAGSVSKSEKPMTAGKIRIQEIE